ncbi:gliding motility-associated C-terminal domain-containing protein, partial [Flavobacterium sp. SUN052]|uniref:T9SS type B sorting domain-containing protein n=1 Tax=Flavobacterium sp. SUN052 TaxID=3002441 RepID=UPI00237D34D4
TPNTNTFSGLTPDTCYNLYVRAVCSPTDSSAWSTAASITTQVAPPVCGGTFTDPGGATANYSNNTDSTVTICPINPGDVVTVTFTSFNTEATWDGLYVFNGNSIASPQITSGNGAGNVPGGLAGSYWGTAIPGPFNGTLPGGCLTFRFRSDGIINNPGWTANVTCAPPPTCPAPTVPVTSAVTSNSGTLSWTNNSTATQFEVLALPCTAPAPTATSTGTIITPTTPNTYTFTGLTPSTCYTLYVRAVCSPTDSSTWTTGATITTQIAPPACGGIFTDLGGPTANYANGTDNTVTICPINATDILTVTFTEFSTEANWDGLYVFDGNSIASPQISSGNGAGNVPGGLAGSFWGTTIPGPFSGTLPGGCLTFRFRSDGSVNAPGWVANVTCDPVPTCPKPVALTATNVTQTSATLSWTEIGTATAWEIIILPVGSPIPTSGTLGIATTNPYYVTNLPPGTAYTFYVRSICSPTDIGPWSIGSTFGTLPVNDECTNATFAIVNQNLNCVQTTPGTLVGATQSLPNVNCPPGVANDDVWYTFTATAATHIISFNNVLPANTAINYAIFQGTNCGSLTQVACNSGAGLTAGNVYYIRVYSTSAAPQFATFNLCIGTLPCTEAPAFCTGQTVTYANSTNVPSLGQIGCLFTSPNPAFFFLQVNQAGPLSYLISQVDNGGIPRDVDYVAWGPFTDLSSACSGVPQNPLTGATPIPTPATGCPGTLHACSYSAAPQEIMCIPNAQLCEVYVIMITNFSNQAGTVTFTQTNNGGGTTACFPINTFNYPLTTYCQDGVDPTPVLAPSATAGTYTSTPGLVIDPVTGTVDLSASTPGAYVVTSSTATTIGGTCNTIPFITTTRTIIITAPANASISYPQPSYCNNINTVQTITRTGTTGGNYTALPAGLSLDPNTGNMVPSASTPGTYTVNYSIAASGGCAPFSTTTTVTIIQSSVANTSFSYPTPVCAGGMSGPTASPIFASGFTFSSGSGASQVNGIFTATPTGAVIDPNTGVIDLLLSIPGTYTITYSIGNNASVCAVGGSSTAQITINPIVSPVFTPISSICQNSVATSLPLTDNNGITGTWSPATIDTSTLGTTTYFFTPDNPAQCSTSASMDILITTPITPTFSAVANICQDFAPPALPTTSSEGVVGSWSPASIDTSVPGNYSFTFTPNSGQCAVNGSLSVTIDAPSIVPTFNAIANICQDLAAPTLPNPSTNGITGTWSPSTIDTTIPGTYTFIFTPDPAQCAVTTTINVTIDAPSIVPTFNAIANICQDLAAPSLPNPSINGITGTWSPSTIDTTIPGTYTFIFTPDPAQCAVTTNINVTIDAPSIVPTFNAIANICLNATAPTLALTSNNAITGTWSPTTIDTSVVGTSNYTFTPDPAQCAVSKTISVTIVAPTQAVFAQIQAICQGNTAPNLPSTSSNGIAGSWSPSTINTSNAGVTVYTFTPNAGLCALGTTMSITINPQPTVPVQSSVEACNNYTLPALTIGNYYTGQNGTGTQLSVGAVISATTTLYVYAQSGTTPNCTDEKPLSITITPSPVFTIIGGCQGPVYVLEVVPGPGSFNVNNATYSWLNPSGTVISGATNYTLIVPTNLAGTYTCIVTVPNGSGSCSNNGSFNANDVTCTIPKGISPNGDGMNDTFDLTGFNVKQLNIFNRYGTIVYAKSNYNNEWFGQSDSGNELPDGTYYFVIERDGQESRSGWVYINRENR